MVSQKIKSDAQLRRDVEDELVVEPSVDSTAIGVAVKVWNRNSFRSCDELLPETGCGKMRRASCWGERGSYRT